MSIGSTGINIEDVQVMLQQLRRFRETIGGDWNSVTSQWQNLQSSWQDSQRNKFEPIFESLCETYSKSEQQQEEYIQFLENLIHAAENAMGMGSINNLNGFEQGVLISNNSLGLSKSSKESSDSAQDKINDIINRGEKLAQQTASTINATLKNITQNKNVKNIQLVIKVAQSVVGIASILCSSAGYSMPTIKDIVSGKSASSLFEKKDNKDKLEDAVKQNKEYLEAEEEKRKRSLKREAEASIRNANEPKISQQIPS